jgi:peroxiredoxin Q/BCP
MQIKVGDKFPDFKLNDENSDEFSLYKNNSKNYLVLYFYPKDETPGCTKQACYFKDFYEEFITLNCEIIGISSDDEKSHTSFKTNYNLPFKLLSDKNSKLRKELNLPKDFLGLSPGRITFLLNNNNEVLFIHRSSLKMRSHIDEVLNYFEKKRTA